MIEIIEYTKEEQDVIYTSASGAKFQKMSYEREGGRKNGRVHIRFESGYEKSVQASAATDGGSIKDPFYPSVQGVGYLGVEKLEDLMGLYPWLDTMEMVRGVYQLWKDKIDACFRNRYASTSYGGTWIHPEWLCFKTFARDLPYIPGFQDWLKWKQGRSKTIMELDKDGIRRTKRDWYGPGACVFLTKKENMALQRDQPKKGTGAVFPLLPVKIYSDEEREQISKAGARYRAFSCWRDTYFPIFFEENLPIDTSGIGYKRISQKRITIASGDWFKLGYCSTPKTTEQVLNVDGTDFIEQPVIMVNPTQLTERNRVESPQFRWCAKFQKPCDFSGDTGGWDTFMTPEPYRSKLNQAYEPVGTCQRQRWTPQTPMRHVELCHCSFHNEFVGVDRYSVGFPVAQVV